MGDAKVINPACACGTTLAQIFPQAIVPAPSHFALDTEASLPENQPDRNRTQRVRIATDAVH